MTPTQLDKLIEESPDQMREVLGDLHSHIREACAAAIEETQDSETAKPKVKVAVGIVIDLGVSPPSWTMSASVGITRKVTSESHSLDDQPELAPGIGKGRKQRKGDD